MLNNYEKKNGLKYCLAIVAILFFTSAFAQWQNKPLEINTSIFEDNAHHWYDINEKERLIQPKKNQPKYKSTDIVAIADNILLYQKSNGGWPKNYDIMAILNAEQKDTLLAAKNEVNTTFDNRTTYSHIDALSHIYFSIKDDRYKTAILKGLDFILQSQYSNGGWPQYYPLQNNYSRYITYNDDAMAGIMQLLKAIADDKVQYNFIDTERKQKLKNAFDKGLSCVLKTQINDAGKPTVWCQQHNEITLEPAWARKFEPPAICNGESVDIVLLLMSIKHPSKEVIDAVENAVTWFNDSKILYTKVKTIQAEKLVSKYTISYTDKVVVTDSAAPPIWTRFYELKTHRPVFCNRDSKVVYSLVEVDRERRDGYGWYTYGPQKVLNKYAEWKNKWIK
jgi:PelA/Pel-15E family pectate lyase